MNNGSMKWEGFTCLVSSHFDYCSEMLASIILPCFLGLTYIIGLVRTGPATSTQPAVSSIGNNAGQGSSMEKDRPIRSRKRPTINTEKSGEATTKRRKPNTIKWTSQMNQGFAHNGGKVAEPKLDKKSKHKWLVALGSVEAGQHTYHCSGIIVDVGVAALETVLTYAGCVHVLMRKPQSSVFARFIGGYTAEIVDMVPHESFNSTPYHIHNIAVVKISVAKSIKKSLKRLSLPPEDTTDESDGYLATLLNGSAKLTNFDKVDEQEMKPLPKKQFRKSCYCDGIKELSNFLLCIKGPFAYWAFSGSPYYLKRPEGDILYAIRVSDSCLSRNQIRPVNGAIFILIHPFLDWIRDKQEK